MLRFTLVAMAVLMATCYCHAQSDSVNNQLLDEVVVTGQYSPQTVKNSVYQVRVINRDRIIQQGATRLQDILANELNIKFTQDLATGGSNIELMGLSGQNVKILIDGVPLTGRQGTSNEININQVDVNSIERIEIVEGPMSVVYGADALAGVINIITQKNIRRNSYVTARVQEETAGNEYGFSQGIHNQYIEGGWSSREWKFNGGIGRNYFGGWKGYSAGREMDWHKKDQLLGNLFAGYHFKGHTIHYRLDVLNEMIRNPGAFNGNEAIDQDYLSSRFMHQLQSTFHVSDQVSSQVIVSHTNYKREISSTVLKKDGTRVLAQGSGMQDLTRFNGTVIRGTLVYTISPAISVQPGVDINLERGSGERLKEGVQKIDDYAFFVTSEITPVKGVRLRPGVRLIRNSVYDAPPVVPSVNTLFTITPALGLRLSYANGFRSPSIRELFFSFFDANHQIEGNTALQAEYSNSFMGTIEWQPVKKEQVAFTITWSGFYNGVKNLIGIGQSGQNANVFTYVNIDRYKTKGFIMSNKLHTRLLQVGVGTSYTGRFNRFAEVDQTLPAFKWAWEANGNLSYQFIKSGLSLNIYYKYTGKLPAYQVVNDNNQQSIRLSEMDAYHWLDFSLNKKIAGVLMFNTGIRNLLDIKRVNSSIVESGAHADTGPRPIGYGRSFFAGLTFEWHKKAIEK